MVTPVVTLMLRPGNVRADAEVKLQQTGRVKVEIAAVQIGPVEETVAMQAATCE